MQAKIMKFKVSHSMRRGLFLKNGSINKTFGLTIGKKLSVEDAKKVCEIANH